MPPGTAHWFGSVGPDSAQARVEVRPALRMEELFESTEALGRARQASGAVEMLPDVSRLPGTMTHLMPRPVPDHLVAIQDAADEVGLSVETLYRWLRPRRDNERPRPELHRHRVPGDRRTFLDRRELDEALRPSAE